MMEDLVLTIPMQDAASLRCWHRVWFGRYASAVLQQSGSPIPVPVLKK